MMIESIFHRDARGRPRAEYPSPYETVGWFLEQDVQGSFAACDELLSICSDVESGTLPRWVATGNAHTITIELGRVAIENEFAIPSDACCIELEEFRSAVRRWKELLSRP